MWLKDDLERFQYLLSLHLINTIAFLVRFIIICADISSASSDAKGYLVPILLLDLGASVILLFSNIVYVLLRYIGPVIFETDRNKMLCCSQSFAWRLATITCVRCDCHLEHPQAILLTRFFTLVFFELLKFIAFVLACACANKYGPYGLGYCIVAAFSFVPSIFTVVVEYLHHHRLWLDYRPDSSEKKKPTYCSGHRCFLPMAMLNDQQTSHWQQTQCPKRDECQSRNLYHVLMYHSGNQRYPPAKTADGQTVVGFHQTDHKAAYSIAKTGFRGSKTGMLGPGVYFATSLDHTEFKAQQYGTYICAKIDLGRTFRTKTRNSTVPTNYDTVYFEHDRGADEFCVRKEQQIQSWIIVVDQDPNERVLKKGNAGRLDSGKFIEDRLNENVYKGCFASL
ncbi:unnamed protein product [Rotaria magnacalcarata]|uniref:PARP catalytic domain-containing protein n=1 Tax=Rotaria magnacalcarata TaxID=392030 RepID=A0A820HM35_9BILA|nr:unnamed protein product [Rotaria magnacalcarata]CAF4296827.1 unnamed protein product [Rotaria magnacalcarata]